MKRLLIVLLSIIFTVTSLAAENKSREATFPAPKTIDLQDCKIMRILARIWKYTPLVEEERAAWIVLNAKGEYEQISWLRTPQRRMSIWSEELPGNIIAQVHTHGDQLNPRPSEQDASIAQKLNIHVYTLTRKGIWSVAPDGSATHRVERGWFDKTVEKCGEE